MINDKKLPIIEEKEEENILNHLMKNGIVVLMMKLLGISSLNNLKYIVLLSKILFYFVLCLFLLICDRFMNVSKL